MDHYTPTGTYTYYQPPEAYETDFGPTTTYQANIPQPLELHSPIPVGPAIGYFGQCLPDEDRVTDMFSAPAPHVRINQTEPICPTLELCTPHRGSQHNFAGLGCGLSSAFANMHLGCDLHALPQIHPTAYEANSPGTESEFSDYSQRTDHPLQSTFPTPSELLAELTEKGSPASNEDISSDARTESASKARRRAMAKRVGFIPTDPDTISSHEKKRYYLETLEQYIVYLHEQFSLIQCEHPPLQHVSHYDGLNSRSIRTILVHMENTTRELNLRTLKEEEKFVQLRDQLAQREDTSYQQPLMRHN